MPIPNIDWNNHLTNFIPESHRTPRVIGWFKGIIFGSIAWINFYFKKYCLGDSVSDLWSNSVTYNINETVITYFGCYVSLDNSNTGNNPDTTTGFWYKVCPSYVGAFERGSYNSQKLIYEFSLNRYFITTFRQPETLEDGTSGIWYLPLSDIYITTEFFDYSSFAVSSEPIPDSSFSSDVDIYMISSDSLSTDDTTYLFIIWIPISLSVSLGTN